MRVHNQRMITDTRLPPESIGFARIREKRATRRKRELALLLVSLCFVLAALIFNEPFLILLSVFPALASFSQR